MIRKILLSSAALLAVTSASFAADLPNRKAPPVAYVAPVFTWTGFYIGVDVGAGWINPTINYWTPPAPLTPNGSSRLSGAGILGGLYAGYNWQLSNNFLVGLEADVEATGINQSTSTYYTNAGVPNVTTIGANVNLPWQGSMRARVGVVAMPNLLIYATGGLAGAQINTKYTNLLGGGGQDSFSRTSAGWTLGAGVEAALMPNLIARAEYRFTQFDGARNHLLNAPIVLINPNVARTGKINENQVRVGLAYKFGAVAAPVVAKY